MKNFLVVFEGIDGSGKTTLAQNITTHLEEAGYPVLLTRQPGGTNVGKQIRTLVQHNDMPLDPKTEFLLFAADRAQHIATVIKPALQEGKIVLCDRFSDSSIAYQGYGRGLDIPTLHVINTWATSEIKPDLTIYVKVPVELAQQRMLNRGTLCTFEQEKANFFERLSQGFDALYSTRADVLILDGSQEFAVVAEAALKALKTRLML